MNIKPIKYNLYKVVATVQKTVRRTIPAVALVAAVSVPVYKSCDSDTRQYTHQVNWFDVALGKLSDEDIRIINKTRQAPKNTVFVKVLDSKNERLDSNNDTTQKYQVQNEKWHYELANNLLGLVIGTTTLPDGFLAEKGIDGKIRIIKLKTDEYIENAPITKRKNSLKEYAEEKFPVVNLSSEQTKAINLTHEVADGTLIIKDSLGIYQIIKNDSSSTNNGLKQLPEGYELQKNVIGSIQVVPVTRATSDIDEKAVKEKEEEVNIKNEINISTLEAITGILSDKQIEAINTTKQMPQGTVIVKDKFGDFHISCDTSLLQTGLVKLPQGYKVAKSKSGYAVIVPIEETNTIQSK